MHHIIPARVQMQRSSLLRDAPADVFHRMQRNRVCDDQMAPLQKKRQKKQHNEFLCVNTHKNSFLYEGIRMFRRMQKRYVCRDPVTSSRQDRQKKI
jgi:hypothetical protein